MPRAKSTGVAEGRVGWEGRKVDAGFCAGTGGNGLETASRRVVASGPDPLVDDGLEGFPGVRREEDGSAGKVLLF